MSRNNYDMPQQNTLCLLSFNQLKALRKGVERKIRLTHNGTKRVFKILGAGPSHLLLENEMGKQHRIVPRKDPRTKS